MKLAARWGGGLAVAVVAYIVTDRVAPHRLPIGIVLLGLVLGGLSAIVALGLVLVYRAFRIVNFAQVAIGGFGASTAVLLSTGFNWPYPAAIAVGLIAAVAVGGVVGALFEWRFSESPRMVVTVATIGLLQLLGVAQIGLPHLVDHSLSPAATFTFPFHLTFSLGPTVFTADDVLALVAVPVVAIAVGWFLVRTRTGLGIRAAADSGERALLLGVPVRRLRRFVWILAALLSGIGGVLAAPITQTTVGVASGPEDLLPALAAAVLARFESMPQTVVWSLLLSVVQQSVYWTTNAYTYADVALFAVVAFGLAVRRAAGGRTETGLGDWVAVREAARLPERIRSLPSVRMGRAFGLVIAGGLAVSVPALFSVGVTGPLTDGVLYAVIAVSLVVLSGWGGQISLGQFAFVGIGASLTGALLVHSGVDLFVALAAAGAAGAALAVLIGLPALRFPGLELAVVTLAFAVVMSEWVLSPSYFAWLNPVNVSPPKLFSKFDLGSHAALYELSLATLVVALLLARNFRRSRAGRALLATRDSPRTAGSFGISRVRTQLFAFAFAGALAGVAGGLYVISVGGSGFTGIDPTLSVTVFSMAVIGGLGSLSGGILGAAYVWAAVTWLTSAMASLATGMGLLVVLAVFPEGLSGVVFAIRDRLFGLASASEGGGDAPTATIIHEGYLTVEGLDVSIGSTEVLRGVGLGVEGGTSFALLGTNGAGKSTLLRAIAGTLRPRAGRIVVGGIDVTNMSPADRVGAGIALVPGGRGIFPSLTVAENLTVAGWTGGSSERVAEHFPILVTRGKTRAGDLSGGEQQMLALAQALVTNPRLLLVDELSFGLAPTVVAKLFEILRDLVADGMTVMIVEQSVHLAAEAATEGSFLERGRVRFEGALSELAGRSDLLRPVFVATHSAPSVRAESGGGRAISLTGISKHYGGVAALTAVDLEVARGEIVGLIGANGAGKTTLLDVIAGATRPDEGRVEVVGALGRTFQDARMMPSLTVEELLAVASDRHVAVRDPFLSLLWTHEVARSEATTAAGVAELVNLFGLAELSERRLAALSTGTKRIVALAGMLAFEPDVVLLDEPTAGVAEAEGRALAGLIGELRDRTGAGILVADHDVALIAGLADRLVCLHLGEVLAAGSPEEVLSNPLVVDAYLGEPVIPRLR